MLVCKKLLLPFAFACCGALFAQNIQNPVLPGVADAGVMKYNGKYSINAMGITKAMIERISVAKAKEQNGTVICRTRYGNVMASRGSVIPLFVKQLGMGQKITVTVPEMTRFMPMTCSI